MPYPKEKVYTSEDYWNLPEGERAELIDGELIMMAPLSYKHQKLVSIFTQVIGEHIRRNQGDCEVLPAPFAVNLSGNERTWVEPDVSVICDKDKLSARGCEGPPDWIIEIVSPTNPGHDYMKKLWLYQKSGVREYWIVNPKTENVTVYDFGHDDSNSYSFMEAIPVGIYDGSLMIAIGDYL